MRNLLRIIKKVIFLYLFLYFNKCYFMKWIFRYIRYWNILLLLWILLVSMFILLMFRVGIIGNDIYLRKLGENFLKWNNLIFVFDCDLFKFV